MDAVSPVARVTRVNGPLVEVAGLAGVAMHDVIELGEHRLPGEVTAIRGDVATIQAYEYTGGLAPGHPARSRGEPLSARLGPHLLGGIFDGLLRPLGGAPAWLEPGYQVTARGRPGIRLHPGGRDGNLPRRGRQPGLGGRARRDRVPGAGATRAERRGREDTRGRAGAPPTR